jgi:predicted small secreted protein
MKKNLLVLGFFLMSILIVGCGTIAGTIKGVGKDLGSLGKLIDGDK